MITKQCSKCLLFKEIDDNFYTTKGKILTWCKQCFSMSRKKRYKNHQIEEKQSAKKYRIKNKKYYDEYSKIYGIIKRKEIRENAKKRYKKNPEKTLLYTKKYAEKNLKKHLLWKAKTRARNKNLDFNITENDIFLPEKCPVFGFQFISNKENRWYNPSLDRIDNTKGYIKGNVQVISYRANWLKSNATIEELEKLVNYLKSL